VETRSPVILPDPKLSDSDDWRRDAGNTTVFCLSDKKEGVAGLPPVEGVEMGKLGRMIA
jgi:hypothetical protein